MNQMCFLHQGLSVTISSAISLCLISSFLFISVLSITKIRSTIMSRDNHRNISDIKCDGILPLIRSKSERMSNRTHRKKCDVRLDVIIFLMMSRSAIKSSSNHRKANHLSGGRTISEKTSMRITIKFPLIRDIKFGQQLLRKEY